MKIIAGTAHRELAEAIAKSLDTELVNAEVSAFPDGETFVQIKDNVRGQDVFIVQPSCPPTNHHIMELLIIVDALRRASAERITAVIPFYGYARQDRKDRPRVPITAKLVANLLSASGVNRVLTIDLHAPQIQGFFDIPVDHLYARPEVIKHLRVRLSNELKDLVVVSPDVGGVKNARSVAEALGVDFAIVAKHRVSATKVEATNIIGDVEGKHCLIVDDMTETAGTLCAAAEMLKANGTKNIYACVTHAILNEPAREKINNSVIEALFCTDTTPHAFGPKVEVISIANMIGNAMHRIHHGESVTSLFDI